VDLVSLSRAQFALTIMFHYLFPPLTIGLGLVIVYLKGMFLARGEPIYDVAARFWTKFFALNFALGVATGIVMEFQFGTNWAAYSRYVGDVFGSILAAEGIFAFFLESGFLAVLVFGWDRVSPRVHFLAAVLVFLGSVFSSVWITIANSWQQTPAGFALRSPAVNGIAAPRAETLSFHDVVLNPSTFQRLVHVWFGAFLLGAFFVMSISAYYLLRDRHAEFARRSFTGALLLALIFSLAQLASGHANAQMVGEHQPAKLAAFEGIYRGTSRAELHLWGWPDDAAGEVRHGVAIPGMLSLLTKGDVDARVAGLEELKPLYGTPPVWISFQSYHAMVGIGMYFIALTVLATVLRLRRALYRQRWLLWIFVFSVPLAFAANELGWVAAEVGRQPWVVYPLVEAGRVVVPGLLTAAAVSEAVRPEQVVASIAGFSVVYALLFALWVFLLDRKIAEGPGGVHAPHPTAPAQLLDTAAAYTGHEASLTRGREG
jgi:cytochrome d ubiquinol oxidase subunit I